MRSRGPLTGLLGAALCVPLVAMFVLATGLARLPALDLARVADRSALVVDREGRQQGELEIREREPGQG